MTISATSGPLVVYGQNPAQAGTNYQPDYCGDAAPSAFAGGILLLDTRYGFRAAMQAGSLAAVGHYCNAEILAVDEVPATLAVAAIAAAAATVSGTPMTLVSATGAGVVVSSITNVIDTKNGIATTNTTGIVTMPVSGSVLPLGTLFINSTPSFIYYGQNGAIATMDPRSALTRAVSITANAGATGGVFTVRGWGDAGFPLTETITAVAATTVVGKRAFKAIRSVTPGVTDAGHTYSVGTADVFGFPLMVTNFAQVDLYWSGALITANTGFLAGVTTTMTATNGDVRGTYAVQTAADGTKGLQIIISPASYNVGQTNGIASLYGQVQFNS